MSFYLYHLSKFLEQPYEDEVQKVIYLIAGIAKHCAELFVLSDKFLHLIFNMPLGIPIVLIEKEIQAREVNLPEQG